MSRTRKHELGYTAGDAGGRIRTHGASTTITRDGKPFLRIDLATGQVVCWPDGPDVDPAVVATFLPSCWTGSDYRPAIDTDGNCVRCGKPFEMTDDVVEMTPGNPAGTRLVHRHCWTALLAARPARPDKPRHIQPTVEVLTTVDIDGNADSAVVIDGRAATNTTEVIVNPDYGDRRLRSAWRAEAERATAEASTAFALLVRAAYESAEPHCTVDDFNTAVNPQRGVTNLDDLDPAAWIRRGTTLHSALAHPWKHDAVTHDVNAARRTDNTTRAAWALYAVKAVAVVLRETRETRADRLPTEEDWFRAGDVALDMFAALTTEPEHSHNRATLLQHLLEAVCHLSDALGFGQDDAGVSDPLTAPTSWYGIKNLMKALIEAARGPWKEDLTDSLGVVTLDDLIGQAEAEYRGNVDLYPGPSDE